MRATISCGASIFLHSGVFAALLAWSVLPPFEISQQVQVSQGKPIALVMVLPTAASQAIETPPVIIEQMTEPAEPLVLEPREVKLVSPQPTAIELPPPALEVSTIFTPPPADSPSRSEITTELPPAPQKLAEQLPRTTTATPPPPTTASAAVAFQAASELGLDVDLLPSELADNRPPIYPADALNARIEGRVVLRLKISANGSVSSCRLETSSGHAGLDQSAIRAVANWKFAPARRAGEAVEHEILKAFNFVIRK